MLVDPREELAVDYPLALAQALRVAFYFGALLKDYLDVFLPVVTCRRCRLRMWAAYSALMLRWKRANLGKLALGLGGPARRTARDVAVVGDQPTGLRPLPVGLGRGRVVGAVLRLLEDRLGLSLRVLASGPLLLGEELHPGLEPRLAGTAIP